MVLGSGLAMRWHVFGTMVKGSSRVLVREGEADTRAIQLTNMAEHDLWENLRGKGISRLEQVEKARLERYGNLSLIRAHREPKVVDVNVQHGVQTVRIEIGAS